MKKQERQQIILAAKYLAFVLGTLFVLFFHIWFKTVFVMLSLAFYASAFGLITIYEIENYITLRVLKIEKGEEETEEAFAARVRERQHKKMFSFAKFALSGALTVFTIIVMILL